MEVPMRMHAYDQLNKLHWLPVKYRVNFKIATLVFKTMNLLSICQCYCILNCAAEQQNQLTNSCSKFQDQGPRHLPEHSKSVNQQYATIY